LYRLIDFALSNCFNTGLRRVAVLPQYKFASLERHLRLGWGALLGEGLHVIPPQQRVSEAWYQGTADAVYQNIYTLKQELPAHVLILSSDHLYQINYEPFLERHISRGADMTVGCIEVPLSDAQRFGVVDVKEDDKISGFYEEPGVAPALRDKPDRALVSMGIYVFATDALVKALEADACCPGGAHDFGHDIIPSMIAGGCNVRAYNVQEWGGMGEFYWRDIGNVDAYWTASMELLENEPPFALEDPGWPIHTYQRLLPPARVAESEREKHHISQSLLSSGVKVEAADVRRSILSPGVKVGREAEISESVLMDDVEVGPGAHICRAIIDKGVRIPPGYKLGFEPDIYPDRLYESPKGVLVVAKNARLVDDPLEQHFELSMPNEGQVINFSAS
jgi:glucose-1-phosphate adenylyltransferase